MVIPALLTAAEDYELRGAPLAVYVWCIGQLDLQELRPLKVSGIAHALRMKPHTAGRALRLLVVRGYLSRRHMGTIGYAYRLHLSRIPPEMPRRGSSPAA